MHSLSKQIKKIVLWIVSGSRQLKQIRKPHSYELNSTFFCSLAIDVVISGLASAKRLGCKRLNKHQNPMFLMTECAPSSRRLIKNPFCHSPSGKSIWSKGLSIERRHLQFQITETEAQK